MRSSNFLILLLFIAFQSFSQSELPDFATSVKKVSKKVKLDMPLEGRKYRNGTGYSLNPKLLEKMPEKVALVSFFSFDPGMTEIQRWTSRRDGYYNSYKTTHTKVKKRNAVGSSGEMALGFYLQSIDALVKEIESFGISLMLPDEYLDTEEKKNYYENYKVERAKFNEWLTNLGSSTHDQLYGYIGGYKVLDIVNEPYANYQKTGGRLIKKKGDVPDTRVWTMDKCGKMVESLGYDLCTNLEVDAVIVVYFTIFAPKDNKVMLQNVNMHMFGPNPTKLPEGKKKKFNFFKGKFYCGTRVNTELLIWKKKKKKPETEKLDFRGFDIVMQAMTKEMGEYLQKGIEKGKK